MKKISKKFGFRKISLITAVLGIVLFSLNYLFFFENEQIYSIFNMLSAVVVLGIPLFYRYREYKKMKEIESVFPRYLRDVAQNIDAGMTLPQAMKSANTNDYGVLNLYVRELSDKITWGISFDKAMADFAEKTKSKSMKRNVQTLIETHKSGGQMSVILASVAQSLQELEKIKKERASSIYAQMINGYLIYVVFLGVMIGMSTVLIPAFRMGETMPDLQSTFTDMFSQLTIIQGLFAGLAIGKMAEGTFVAGIKHAIVLVVFGYSMFVIFV